MSSLTLILSEISGVEFFTVATTGDSGISVSGLAILCGVTQPAISNLVKKVITGKPTKRLESFIGQELGLITNSGEKGKIRALKAEFCVEVIKYYAYSGNETAQFTLDKFAIAGFNSWVQGITGWQNSAMRSQPPEHRHVPPPVPAALPPAPGWADSDWQTLPPVDQQYFSETAEQKAERVALDRQDMARYFALIRW